MSPLGFSIVPVVVFAVHLITQVSSAPTISADADGKVTVTVKLYSQPGSKGAENEVTCERNPLELASASACCFEGPEGFISAKSPDSKEYDVSLQEFKTPACREPVKTHFLPMELPIKVNLKSYRIVFTPKSTG